MRKLVTLTLVAVLAVFLTLGGLVGCLGENVTGSGNLTTLSYDFRDFTQIEAHSGFQLEVTMSNAFSIEITADDNIHEYIVVEKSGDTLGIRLRGTCFYHSVTLRAEITMPNLYRMELTGGSRADITGFSSSHDFDADLSGGSHLNGDIIAADVEFELSGGSQVNGDITAGNADFELSGGSQVNLEGSGEDLIIAGSGGSQLDLEDFPINDASISLSGGSRAIINISGTLDADLSGGSRIFYIGTPTLGDTEFSGDSGISHK